MASEDMGGTRCCHILKRRVADTATAKPDEVRAPGSSTATTRRTPAIAAGPQAQPSASTAAQL